VIAICLAIFSIGYASAQSADQSSIVGSISGYVYDDSQNGVPGATVSLYNCVNIAGQYQNRGLLNIADNPQTTGNGNGAVKGMFLFNKVPKGTYNLTAEKDGHVSSQIVSVDMISGTTSQNIILNGYTYSVKPPATVTPRPTSAPVIPINVGQPPEMPSLYDVVKILAMAAIGAQMVFCLVVLALFANNKK
jgi:hypothetical protein